MLYHPLAAESQLDLSERTYHVVHDSRTVEYSFGCNQSSDGSTRSSEFSGTGSVQDMQESNKNYLAFLNHQQVNFHLSTTLPTLYMYMDVYDVNACIPPHGTIHSSKHSLSMSTWYANENAYM